MVKRAKNSILMDARMKSKIESLTEWKNNSSSLNLVDIDDAFHFNTSVDLQIFIRNQEVERFYDKSLRKGFFDYINENNETYRYYVKSDRGTLTVLKEEILGVKVENE